MSVAVPGPGKDKTVAETYLGRRSGQRITDPCQRDHVAGVHARDHQHHGQISRCGLGRRSGDNEGDDCKIEREGDVEVPLACPVCMPGIAESGDDTKDVGGNR